MSSHLERPMLALGLPPNPLAWSALLLGVVLLALQFLVWKWPLRKRLFSHPRWSWLLALAALFLSWAYFQHYLAGIPRIIDATAYLLEARTFAQGMFTFDVLEPTAAFRGRFLLHHPQDPTRLGVIFPPGYPALLSVGVLLGAYEWVGPLLGAALVLSTYALARLVTGNSAIALLAALFSVLSATLRYHTADTMSHGWSALLATVVVYATCKTQAALRLQEVPPSHAASETRAAPLTADGVEVRAETESPRHLRWWVAIAGAAAGMLTATRQLTGLVFVFVAALFFLRALRARRIDGTSLALFWAALVPGLLLLLVHQNALTGSPWLTPQVEYYRLSDGPPGCFGLGFGKGCRFEHGEVVARQGGGLDALWAAKNTLHRLHWFSLDIANFELLAAGPVLFMWWHRKTPRWQPLWSAALLLPLAYAFFYFPGSYPGGGARFFVALLPLCHVGLAGALFAVRAVPAGVGLCLIGFALHGSFSHEALAAGVDTELAESIQTGPADAATVTSPSSGLPPQTADSTRSGEPRFVEYDHRFNLLFEPGASKSEVRQWIFRDTGDDRQRLLLERVHPVGPTPTTRPSTFVFEAEHDWPVLALREAWVQPVHLPASCVSGGQALAVRSTGRQGTLTLEATGVPPGRYQVSLWVWAADGCEEYLMGPRELPLRLPIDLEAFSGLMRTSHASKELVLFVDRLVLRPLPH